MKSNVHLSIMLDHDANLPLDADGIADSIARTVGLALGLRKAGDTLAVDGRFHRVGAVTVRLDSAGISYRPDRRA